MKWEPFLIAADTHGDQIDLSAEKKFFEFAADLKPKHRIHLGDWLDLRPLRRGASAEERAERLEEDVVAGQRFLEGFRPDTLLLGNHDMRLWEAMDGNDGMAASYSHRLVGALQGQDHADPRPRVGKGGLFDKLGIKRVLTYHRKQNRYRLGSVNFVHGLMHGMNPAKQHSISYGPSVIHGHTHKYDVYIPRHIDGGMAMSCPCLADLNMRYLDRSVAALAHDNGWVFGVVNTKTGRADYWCVRRQQEDNQWIDPRAKWI